jgi:hypothetical protein
MKGGIFPLCPYVRPPALLCEINANTIVPEAEMGGWGEGEMVKRRRDKGNRGKGESINRFLPLLNLQI